MSAHPDRDDLIAFSLGALDQGEEAAVAAHVEGCAKCTRDLRHYAPAVSVLAESVEQVPPPPELRERLMAIVHDEAAPEAEPARRERGSRFSLRGLLLRPATGLALAAIVAAGVGGFVAADGGGGDAERTVEIGESGVAGAGQLVVHEDESTLEMTGMDQLRQGSVYQVWVADSAGAVTPSATFLPHEDGTATAAIPEAGEDASAVMVTVEPGPNRTEPTLPAVLDVRLDGS